MSGAAAGLGAFLAGIEDLAGSVSRKSRFWAVVALSAAPVTWVLMLRRWVFDGIGPFLGWLPLLAVMVTPGVLLFGFAGRVGRLAALPEHVSSEIAELVRQARAGASARSGRGGRHLPAPQSAVPPAGGPGGAGCGSGGGPGAGGGPLRDRLS